MMFVSCETKKLTEFVCRKKIKKLVSRKQFLALGKNILSILYHARLFTLNRVWKHDVFSIISKVGQLK
jgi:hypothetical protein